MDFNEFREKVKEALPNFVTDDLRNAQIQDAEVNKHLICSSWSVRSKWQTVLSVK